MTHQGEAFELAEAIRATLASEHYPKERMVYVRPEPPICECGPNENTCLKRRLDTAFRRYIQCNPQAFGGIF